MAERAFAEKPNTHQIYQQAFTRLLNICGAWPLQERCTGYTLPRHMTPLGRHGSLLGVGKRLRYLCKCRLLSHCSVWPLIHALNKHGSKCISSCRCDADLSRHQMIGPDTDMMSNVLPVMRLLVVLAESGYFKVRRSPC